MMFVVYRFLLEKLEQVDIDKMIKDELSDHEDKDDEAFVLESGNGESRKKRTRLSAASSVPKTLSPASHGSKPITVQQTITEASSAISTKMSMS